MISQANAQSGPSTCRIANERSTTPHTKSATVSHTSNNSKLPSDTRFGRVKNLLGVLKQVEPPSPKPKVQACLSLKPTGPGNRAKAHTAPMTSFERALDKNGLKAEDLYRAKKKIAAELREYGIELQTLRFEDTERRSLVLEKITFLQTRLGIVENGLRRMNACEDGGDASAKPRRRSLSTRPVIDRQQQPTLTLSSTTDPQRIENEKLLAKLTRINSGLNDLAQLIRNTSDSSKPRLRFPKI